MGAIITHYNQPLCAITLDGGASWWELDYRVWSVARHESGRLVGFTDLGVAESWDGGLSWEPIDIGLNDVDIYDILCNGEQYLVVVADANGTETFLTSTNLLTYESWTRPAGFDDWYGFILWAEDRWVARMDLGAFDDYVMYSYDGRNWSQATIDASAVSDTLVWIEDDACFWNDTFYLDGVLYGAGGSTTGGYDSATGLDIAYGNEYFARSFDLGKSWEVVAPRGVVPLQDPNFILAATEDSLYASRVTGFDNFGNPINNAVVKSSNAVDWTYVAPYPGDEITIFRDLNFDAEFGYVYGSMAPGTTPGSFGPLFGVDGNSSIASSTLYPRYSSTTTKLTAAAGATGEWRREVTNLTPWHSYWMEFSARLPAGTPFTNVRLQYGRDVVHADSSVEVGYWYEQSLGQVYRPFSFGFDVPAAGAQKIIFKMRAVFTSGPAGPLEVYLADIMEGTYYSLIAPRQLKMWTSQDGENWEQSSLPAGFDDTYIYMVTVFGGNQGYGVVDSTSQRVRFTQLR